MKIMIVDDEKPIRQWFKIILSEIDKVEVVGDFSNGRDALEKIEELKPDIIFTDILMPIMNGVELIKNVKNQYPHVEILILSNYDDFEYVSKGLKYGARDYLLKAQSDDEDIIQFLNEVESTCNITNIDMQNEIADNTTFDNGWVVSEIKKYIIDNYNQPITLVSLAEKFNYHPDYLSQIFKQYTGENFKTYLINIKMETAKELLKSGNYLVKDIASMLGYSNEMYFSTAFKNYTGVSPSQFGKIF
ncbi:MAG: response regulator [Lachnospirales bacterium]